jgi:multidrug efflux pump subunit AcrA (membrane-fusion protein)
MGSVIPAEEISVGFQNSGILTDLFVQVGDKVSAGDVLGVQGNTTQLEATITSDRLSLLSAQQELDDLYIVEDDDEIDLKIAVAQLEIIRAEKDLEDVIEAREHMDYPRCSQETIDAYFKEYDDAKNRVEELEARGATFDVLTPAKSARDTAFANYYYCSSPRTEEEINEADAQIELAQATLNAAILNADSLLDVDEPDADEIAMAEAKLASAEAQLAVSLEKLEATTLVAPIDGTVMEVKANEGETVGTSTLITLADLDQPMLEIYMDETDLDKVGEGFEVEVIFDALPDELFIGNVIYVEPFLSTVSGVQVVRAIVELDPASFAKPKILPVGLNASVEVIGGQGIDVLLVPVEALREIGPDEYAVFVMEDGEPKLRMVTVGLMDFTFAEIIDGLEESDTITTGIVETE